MTGCRHTLGVAALAMALLCLAPATPAFAMTAYETFQDGNRLFRDDLYWAALLRYRQAAEAGMRSPLLDYNTGMAHYRAGQHVRARVALVKASQSPGLRVLSHYNLGLNAYALGDLDDSLAWFRRAREQQENAKIRRLATIAISRIQAERRAEDPIVIHEEKRREEREIGVFNLTATVGFGSDDNIYRSPAGPYVDFSNPNQPVAVIPEVVSGSYVPVDFHVKYDVNAYRWESFFGSYRLSGRYYTDKELENANEYSHELRIGSEFDRREETRSTRVYSAFTIAQHDETYFDPDDGLERTVPVDDNGVIVIEPIGERLNYVRFGPEFNVRRSHDRLSYGLRVKGQMWDYEDTDVVPEYDHEYFLFGANVQYRFTSTSLLRLTADKSSRRYGDRPSFNLNGQQLVTNPAVRYDYLEIGMLARQRITRNMWFGFGYKHAIREDRFVGYNDYTRDQYSFEYHWSPGRFDMELGAYYRIYDYPNAFAYNNPALPVKTLETAFANMTLSYRITPSISVVGEFELRESTSTDARIGYDRNWYSIGVVWRQ